MNSVIGLISLVTSGESLFHGRQSISTRVWRVSVFSVIGLISLVTSGESRFHGRQSISARVSRVSTFAIGAVWRVFESVALSLNALQHEMFVTYLDKLTYGTTIHVLFMSHCLRRYV